MLEAFRPGPTMRSLVSFFGVPLLLTLSASSTAVSPVVVPACPVVAIRAAPLTQPPAWLLLAGAVVLLGAGRVATS
jgi:hypothetical protein